jgi:transketolase
MTPTDDLAALSINTIRFLAVDMVEKAKSGHPGAPLGQAPLAYLIWSRFLRHDPKRPDWPDRDRFVLSCGHASALLYALLHLSGYDLPMSELERFRQLGSKTPGHPEHELTEGVETTTGPLGQGISNAVGMAMAREMLAARFNRPGLPLVDHRIWVFASDGDLMEGVASEAASLAGHLKLASLKVFYDANQISIDGPTDLAFSEDVGARFAAYGWRVLHVADGNDLDALERAAREAESEHQHPTLVVVRTHIGYGSPHKQDTAEAHGEPLGPEEVKATKQALGWPLEPTFLVPESVREHFAEIGARGATEAASWDRLRARYAAADAEAFGEFEARLRGELPAGWDVKLPVFTPENGAVATRDASGKVLQALHDSLPQLVGGSADLTPSNKTLPRGASDFSATNRGGRYLRFGVREHAMGAVLNGIALSGMFIPYGGTFLIFYDYMRPAVRLAALMRQHVVYVYTHDSIFLGEDGPTHQPVEQLLGLRAVPGLTLLRPADACETVEAWRLAITARRPVALALTRQKLPTLAESAARAREGLPRGAYILADPEGSEAVAILMASGSEVALAMEAHRTLAGEGIPTRVVSFPSWDLFEAQDEDYRRWVLPSSLPKRLAIEAGSPIGWHRWVGEQGDILAQEEFGASAPAPDLARHFRFTAEEAAGRVRRLLRG